MNHLPKISLLELRDLSPLSATSGIVKVDDVFYVISDDETSLFSFSLKGEKIESHSLVASKLPVDPVERKKHKPDFESLALLSAKEWPPYGALVAWPSASKLKRMTAAIIPFDKNKKLGKVFRSDILPLAYLLESKVKKLNVEGLFVRDKKVFFVQRGNAKNSESGLFEVSLDSWITGMKTGDWSSIKVEFEDFKLGKWGGVKLTPTEMLWTKYGLLCLAAAEDSDSSYADGEVMGTVLARIIGSKVQLLGRFDSTAKLEGLVAEEDPSSDGLILYLVDDADNPNKKSKLYSARVTDAQLAFLVN